MRSAEVDFGEPDLTHFHDFAREIEYPDAQVCLTDDVTETLPPITLSEGSPTKFYDLTLQEAIATALTTAEVLRDLQGRVLSAPRHPDSLPVHTIQDPAIQETDPNYGIEAALSRFDAQFATRMFFEKNDRALNNVFFGGGTRLLTQDLHAYSAEIWKRTATGASYALRHNVDYDFNNSPGNDLPRNRPWDVNLEAEFRQPLLRGAGIEFNRIAGPDSAPGRANGVVIARLNTDMVLADFEVGVRDFVNNVESIYWELYYAYRELDTKIAARDRALETWRRIHTLYVNGRRGGEAEKEAQSREQYFRLQEEVENALGGRMIEHSRHETFHGTGGVQATERRLRKLMGIPISDGLLLRPVDEPIMAKVVFDWNEITVEAVNRRAELRRQKWIIRRREMELIAARNFVKPQLDAIGRYRWRGLGSDLLHSPTHSPDRFDNAYNTMLSGDFQEWQLGLEFSAPLGFRQGHAAIRQQELHYARERAILEEQQREIIHDLSGAYADVDRTYIVSQTNYNRRRAAQQQLAALEAVYEDADQNEKTRLLDLLLDAQRRMADAEIRYYRARVEYAFAIKEVHRQKGSLLDYNEIYLAEGPWPGKAYFDACRRNRQRSTPKCLKDYRMAHAPIVSQGPYAQDIVASDPVPSPVAVPPVHTDDHASFNRAPQGSASRVAVPLEPTDAHVPEGEFQAPSPDAVPTPREAAGRYSRPPAVTAYADSFSTVETKEHRPGEIQRTAFTDGTTAESIRGPVRLPRLKE